MRTRLTDQRDNDHEDPSKLDRGGNDLHLAKEPDRKNINEDDHYPEDCDPGRNGHLICPKIEDRDDTLSSQHRTLSYPDT